MTEGTSNIVQFLFYSGEINSNRVNVLHRILDQPIERMTKTGVRRVGIYIYMYSGGVFFFFGFILKYIFRRVRVYVSTCSYSDGKI